ncbi:hypothetical protein [Oceanobacillus sp. J11TS1]|uniref:hypothetical protein n=1 Tax=Oceanobacillus sp. J11TS1 TaxID=2807191 RepID=UPI001B26802C|nr:hypothetical protein [Oceanobacillus sp. J11TS1]GIO22491.1 hypothetical protein J11TS1_10720 [Oceanobacillus sp. J11TS1]
MAEITEKAYESLRQYIIDQWHYIELQDEDGNPIIRLSPDDPRVEWVHELIEKEEQVLKGYDPMGYPIYETKIIKKLPNTLQIQIIIKGVDISTPKTFAKSAIYDVRSDGEPLSIELFTPFVMINENDSITVVHNIEVPQL